jgi:sodium/bile acid cotransporter 7
VLALVGAVLAASPAGQGRSRVLVIPLMSFYQLQLMVCAILARRYAARPA